MNLLVGAFLCYGDEHRDSKDVLQYLIQLVPPVDSITQGIVDGVWLPGIEEIMGGVLGKYFPDSNCLLLVQSNQQAPK